jgi:membrane protein
MALRRTARQVVAAYDEHDVLTYAGAIAFKLAFSLIPLTLVGLGLLGAFDLAGSYRSEVAPDLQREVSPAVFAVLDQTVRHVLDHRQLLWSTVGVALALWEISGATRGVMGVLDRIFRVGRERSFAERIAVSVALAVAATVLGLLAVAMLEFGSGLVDALAGTSVFAGVAATVVSWALGLGCLALLLAILVRYAPAEPRSWRLVTRGSALTLGGWVGASALFGLYLRELADYGTLFGNLATVIVVFEYLYLSSVVLLTGLVLDALFDEV